MYLARSSCVICGKHINKIQYNLKTTFTEKSNVLLIKLIEKLYKNVLFLHCNICTACYNVLNELDTIQQRQKELYDQLKENISKIDKTNFDKCLSSDNEDDIDYTDSAHCTSPGRSTITRGQSKKDDFFKEEIKVDSIDLKKLPITIKRVKAETRAESIEINMIDATSEKIREKLISKITKEEVDENNKLFEKIQSSIKKELFNRNIEQTNKEKPSKDLLCEICGMCFKLQVGYLNHIKKHDDAKDEMELLAMQKQTEWTCNVCNKTFHRKAALKRHLPIHTGEARYQCEHCGKEFIHQSSFRMHLKIHANQRDAICEICQHPFLTRSHLKRHLKTAHRPSVKEYRCSICQKQFANKHYLDAHINGDPSIVEGCIKLEQPMANENVVNVTEAGLNTNNEVVNTNHLVMNKNNVVLNTNNGLLDAGNLTIYNMQNGLPTEEGILRIHEPTTGLIYTIKCSNLF